MFTFDGETSTDVTDSQCPAEEHARLLRPTSNKDFPLQVYWYGRPNFENEASMSTSTSCHLELNICTKSLTPPFCSLGTSAPSPIRGSIFRNTEILWLSVCRVVRFQPSPIFDFISCRTYDVSWSFFLPTFRFYGCQNASLRVSGNLHSRWKSWLALVTMDFTIRNP